MHEVSIAATIWEQVRSVEKCNPGFEAKRIEIDVGTFSGVESILLADALESLIKQTNRHEVEFVLNAAALVAHCDTCLSDFPVENFRFLCVICGGKKLKLIDGDSIRLMHVDLQSI